MSLFIYPPLVIAGGSTEVTAAAILDAVDGLETLVTSSNTKLDTLHTDVEALTDKTPAVFFTKKFDEIAESEDATHNYYQTKLVGVNQELLTTTFVDASKAKVVNHKLT
jgi:hypothetical protein